jgi:hypothetical protein
VLPRPGRRISASVFLRLAPSGASQGGTWVGLLLARTRASMPDASQERAVFRARNRASRAMYRNEKTARFSFVQAKKRDSPTTVSQLPASLLLEGCVAPLVLVAAQLLGYSWASSARRQDGSRRG